MSGVPREVELGMEEKEPTVLLQEDTSFDDDDEEVTVTQQTAAEIFERVHPHRWPVPGSFSFGGILGGVSSGGGAGGFGGKGSEGSGPWWQSLGSVPTARRMWMVIAGVVMAIFVAVAVTGGGAGGSEDQEGDESPLSAGAPRPPGGAMPGREESFYKTSPLRSRLQEVADAALSEGVTMPMHTTFEVVRAGDREGEGEEGGMDFIVSVMATKALEAKATVASPPSTAASTDPFDARVLDPRMTVEELPPAHSLVLNKFNTVRNHALIITKEFQSQEEALTEADFSAWYRVVEQLPAVGFYNSAVEAGASQRHKHMQVIPEDALREYRPQATEAIPVDEPISRLVGSSRDFSRVWRVPGFHFQHALTLIPSIDELSTVAVPSIDEGTGVVIGAENDLSKMAAYLRDRYVTLLGEVGFDTSSLLHRAETGVPPSDENASAKPSPGVPPSSLPPYNALLTSRWLMVVPRSKREWEGIDVNGMGFFGALLVREKALPGEGAGIEAVRGPGALAVLEGVTFQSKSS